MQIQDLLHSDACDLNADVDTKPAAMEHLLELMAHSGCISDMAAFRQNVLEREQEVSTGCDGLAVPHGRCSAVLQPALAIMRTQKGCPFDAIDGKPVRLFFLIAAQDGTTHMQMLSRLATLLMDKSLVQKLLEAADFNEFRALLQQADIADQAKSADAQPVPAQSGSSAAAEPAGLPPCTVVAITACPTGVAHTYMAESALYDAAASLGIRIKVETHGASGVQHPLSADEIAACHGVIIAADRTIDLSRFAGKPMLQVPVSSAMRYASRLVQQADRGEGSVSGPNGLPLHNSPASETRSLAHSAYNALMNGVSHMLPLLLCGGILTAFAYLLDTLLAPNASFISFGANTPAGGFLRTVGNVSMELILPVLAGYIAYAVGDRPALVTGFVSGWLAAYGYCFRDGAFIDSHTAGYTVPSSGFIGAITAGFLSGLVLLGLKKLFAHMPPVLDSVRLLLLYPLLSTVIVSAIMIFLLDPLFSDMNSWASLRLASLNTGGNPLLDISIGALLAAMMAIDLGGPINKAAYLFATATLVVNGAAVSSTAMASTMAGGMVPPLALALCSTIFPHYFTEKERKLRLSTFVMGACFLTEGAIPYAATDPLRVLPSCVVGSACAGALSMLFGCRLPAPHGGIFVLPIMQHSLLFLLAVAAGSVVGMFVLLLLKRTGSLPTLHPEPQDSFLPKP